MSAGKIEAPMLVVDRSADSKLLHRSTCRDLAFRGQLHHIVSPAYRDRPTNGITSTQQLARLAGGSTTIVSQEYGIAEVWGRDASGERDHDSAITWRCLINDLSRDITSHRYLLPLPGPQPSEDPSA